MNVKNYDGLACPLDGYALHRDGNSLRCADGHCFDLDKRGAVNMLPVQLRKSKNPGDSKEMVLARTRVLDSGVYAPIADAVREALKGAGGLIVDAGCGEGYYTTQVAEDADDRRCIGVDISKDAITAASKRSGPVTWCVGTNARLPIIDGAAAAVMCLFGFPVYHEFARVLAADGLLLMVDPADDHLIELRRHLYNDVQRKENAPVIAPDGFVLRDRRDLCVTQTAPDAALLHDLVMMTPHGYRSSPERITDAVRQLAGKPLTLHVRCAAWRKGA